MPGWGLELSPERVLSEMQELGLVATELGSAGYLPSDPNELRALCSHYGLAMIGGFVPLVLHDPAQRRQTLADTRRAAQLMGNAGGTEFITSMVASLDWGPRFELDAAGWDHTAVMLAEVEADDGASLAEFCREGKADVSEPDDGQRPVLIDTHRW